jgi:drug/metabolite transporter (DMT)-like permease
VDKGLFSYAAPIACVLGLSIGQILFKASARRLSVAGTPIDMAFLATLGTALLLYGVVSIAWVWILQRVELSRVYPLMALSFVFVPLGSWLVYRETFGLQYVLGAGLIIAGIAVIGLKLP